MFKRLNLSLINTVYVCFMIVYMAVREVTALNFLINSNILSAAIFLFGAILIFADLLTSRKCLKGRTQDLLILFLVICGVSSIINIKLGLFDNIKFIAAIAIEYFVFFCFVKEDSKEEITKKLNITTATLIVTWSVILLCSVMMYFFNIDITIMGRGSFGQANQGFSTEYSRLWGILQDPNYAGATSIISIFASLRFIFINKKVGVRILNVLNIALQMIYIILGGSRAALLLLFAAIVLYAIYKFILSEKKRTVAKVLKGVLLTGLTVVICAVAVFGTKAGLPYVKAMVFSKDSSVTRFVLSSYTKLYSASGYEFEVVSPIIGENGKPYPGDTSDEDPSDTTTPDKPIQDIGRTDLEKEDVSNGRFTRWQQTLEIFLKAPIFGTSPRNLTAFARINNPDTLMARFSIAPHNGYLDVLVETGIVGFGVLASVIILALFTAIKNLFRSSFSSNIAFSLLAVIVLAGIAFFVSDVFMLFSMNSMLFWLFLGFAYNYGAEHKSGELCHVVYSKTVGRLTDKIFSKKEQI